MEEADKENLPLQNQIMKEKQEEAERKQREEEEERRRREAEAERVEKERQLREQGRREEEARILAQRRGEEEEQARRLEEQRRAAADAELQRQQELARKNAEEAEARRKAEEEENARRLEEQMRLDSQKLDAFLKEHGYTGANVKRTKMLKSKYPLHTAVKKNDPDLVRILLAAGADPGAKNSAGLTAAQLAKKTDKKGSHASLLLTLDGY
jgi:hypothetical protein